MEITRIAILTLLLSGCSTMSSTPLSGWPELRVIEHYVPHAEMKEHCSKYAKWYETAEACAEWNFSTGECHIWLSADFPPPHWIIEHERKHCQGYIHS